jgi:hypothetical protein
MMQVVNVQTPVAIIADGGFVTMAMILVRLQNHYYPKYSSAPRVSDDASTERMTTTVVYRHSSATFLRLCE